MKEFFAGNKALKSVIQELAETAGYLWQRGWAERNAGNISVNISDLISLEIPELNSIPFFELPTAYPILAGACFLVTGTGKRMRDLAYKPLKNVLIIKLNEKASGYYILSQKVDDEKFMPTSELPTHLGIHQMIAERGSLEKVVIHTHTTELVALTQAKEFCSQDTLNKLLWGMHPETIIFVPKGVGFVPYILPGSAEIAEKTMEALGDHDVVLWEKHGVFAIGKGVSDTFDVIDILAKSAHIFFMCRSVNIIPDGFTDQQLNELRKLTANF